jgi:outer membrane biosynthesis protein TonB
MESEQIIHDVAERVRAIVTEAEERAAQIVRDAEQDAQRIRARAESEGRERLDQVRQALDELQGRLGTEPPAPRTEVTPGPVIVPEPQPPAQPEPGPEPVPDPAPDPTPEPAPPTIPEPTPPPDEGTPPQVAVNGEAGKSADTTAARLVAMNMALDGAAREAIESHLSEFYALDDPGAIVDDVLALTAR